MTDKFDAPGGSRRGVTLALVALVATAGAGLLYVSGAQTGKDSANGACAAARTTSEAVAPLAKGEVAAMTIAKNPSPMPDLVFNGPDGQPKTLADFRGKTILLNLWATWCVPCRQEMAALDRLQARAGSEKFEVVTVNVDTARLDRPKAFLEEIGAKHLAYYSDPKAEIFFKLKQTGGVMGLPTTFLIDGSSCQIGLMPGPAAWDSAEGQALVIRTAEASSRPTP